MLANCDDQVLLYESDPLYHSSTDIAKLQIILFASHAKATKVREQRKCVCLNIILEANEVNRDDSDAAQTAHQIHNNTVGEKMISN